jgi:hypothetical protein
MNMDLKDSEEEGMNCYFGSKYGEVNTVTKFGFHKILGIS